MSAQVIGERKRQQAERETGLTIDRLLRLSNRGWEARSLTDNGHQHLRIDPVTWKVETPIGNFCWTTCGQLPEQHRRRESEGA